MTFRTAGGETGAKMVCDVTMKSLSETITPYVLANTPAVYSVGKRCNSDTGISYLWLNRNTPCFLRDDGYILRLIPSTAYPTLVLEPDGYIGPSLRKRMDCSYTREKCASQ